MFEGEKDKFSLDIEPSSQEQKDLRDDLSDTILTSLDDLEARLRFEEITNKDEAIDLVNKIVTDEEYADWKERIPKFLDDYAGDWRMQKVLTPEGDTCGLMLLSSSLQKMNKWNQKFLSQGCIEKPIDMAHSLQFAYFYINSRFRGKGYGKKALEEMKNKERAAGIKKIYGFSRYTKPISLYQEAGAKILNQTSKDGELRSYYYWDLEEE